MIRPVTHLVERPRRVSARFVLAETLLVVAVPVLGFFGLGALLDSRAGTFVEEPGPADPGYRALVQPTPITAVVEILDERLTGLAIISQPAGESGGAVLLVSGELEIDGVRLASLGVDEAIAAVEGGLALDVRAVEVVDEARWLDILGSTTFAFDNPDPIGALTPVETEAEGKAETETDTGSTVDNVAPRDVMVAPGEVVVDGNNLGLLLGAPGLSGNAQSLLFRRSLLWTQLLSIEVDGADPVADLLTGVAAGGSRVEVLATSPGSGGGLVLDPDQVESQILELVPFPAGSQPGDRLRVRILDQLGTAEVLAVASRLASLGYEVVEIGNSAVFAEPGTVEATVIVPLGFEDDRISDLIAETGAARMVSSEIDADPDGVVTLLVAD